MKAQSQLIIHLKIKKPYVGKYRRITPPCADLGESIFVSPIHKQSTYENTTFYYRSRSQEKKCTDPIHSTDFIYTHFTFFICPYTPERFRDFKEWIL